MLGGMGVIVGGWPSRSNVRPVPGAGWGAGLALAGCGSTVDDEPSRAASESTSSSSGSSSSGQGGKGGGAGSSGVGGAGGGGQGGSGGGEGCGANVAPAPGVVITDSGAIRGKESEGTWAYLGIPYAKPPVGTLRWALPAAPGCWDGIRDAMELGPACPQLDEDGAVVGDEDCLTINVWAPKDPPPVLLPVLVFLHGGGNVQGASSQKAEDGTPIDDDAKLAASRGVVVVTLHYRLGAMGFLAHPLLTNENGEAGTSGSYGLYDQLFALEWVQRNAERFGGDPNRVLLFGESAGGLDTCLLVTSPLAKGLFSAALVESGGCVARPLAEGESLGVTFATEAGCGGAADPVACLRGLSAQAVIEAHPVVPDVAGKLDPTFQPTIDGLILTGNPMDVLESGMHNHVPFVVGANSDETSRVIPPMSEAGYEQAVKTLFGEGLGEAVLAAYPVADYDSPRAAMVALTSDAKFICPARRIARAVAGAQAEPVYRYHFTHALENAGPAAKALGAWHGLELAFVFGHIGLQNYVPSSGEQALSAAMAGYWSRFAASGDPNEDGAPVWPSYDPETDTYLELDTTITAAQGVRTAQCDFWDSFLPP